MNAIRLALILLAGWIIWRLVSARLDQRRRNQALKREEKKRLTPETMVQCAHCGLHVLEKHAVYADGRPYCSPEHRDADANRRP